MLQGFKRTDYIKIPLREIKATDIHQPKADIFFLIMLLGIANGLNADIQANNFLGNIGKIP